MDWQVDIFGIVYAGAHHAIDEINLVVSCRDYTVVANWPMNLLVVY